jgi:hypothetical protein
MEFLNGAEGEVLLFAAGGVTVSEIGEVGFGLSVGALTASFSSSKSFYFFLVFLMIICPYFKHSAHFIAYFSCLNLMRM